MIFCKILQSFFLWNRVCRFSALPFRSFVGIVSVFSKFRHDARNPYEVVCHRARFSGKIFLLRKLRKWTKFFQPKNWENGRKMGQKQGFLNLLKNLVINFYWICSIMKISIIFCALAEIPCFGKLFIPKIWSKIFSTNEIVGFFYRPYLQNKTKLLIFCMLIQIHIN